MRMIVGDISVFEEQLEKLGRRENAKRIRCWKRLMLLNLMEELWNEDDIMWYILRKVHT